jgi:hypothetical protein
MDEPVTRVEVEPEWTVIGHAVHPPGAEPPLED